MTDTEMLDAMDSGQVNVFHLCRSRAPHRTGQWEWYDVSVEPHEWREAANVRECIERLQSRKGK